MEEIKDERELVRSLKGLFEKSGSSILKKVYINVNLAKRRFHELWAEWWESEVSPRLEIDMIPVFEDVRKLKEVFIPGVEVEFFKDKTKTFVDGLQQALSFGLFGFDSLVLWHVFPEKMEGKSIEQHVRHAKEIIEGLNLPVVYFATRLTEQDRFEFFAPWSFYSSMSMDANYLLTNLRKCCDEKRNPLLYKEEVEKRKKMLKVLLKIPI